MALTAEPKIAAKNRDQLSAQTRQKKCKTIEHGSKQNNKKLNLCLFQLPQMIFHTWSNAAAPRCFLKVILLSRLPMTKTPTQLDNLLETLVARQALHDWPIIPIPLLYRSVLLDQFMYRSPSIYHATPYSNSVNSNIYTWRSLLCCIYNWIYFTAGSFDAYNTASDASHTNQH
jgi:hypothetical protein